MGKNVTNHQPAIIYLLYSDLMIPIITIPLSLRSGEANSPAAEAARSVGHNGPTAACVSRAKDPSDPRISAASCAAEEISICQGSLHKTRVYHKMIFEIHWFIMVSHQFHLKEDLPFWGHIFGPFVWRMLTDVSNASPVNMLQRSCKITTHFFRRGLGWTYLPFWGLLSYYINTYCIFWHSIWRLSSLRAC